MIKFDLYEVVSFDLFDTFFLRKIKEPADIFSIVEFISKKNNFKINRILAEDRARKTSRNDEITLDEIYEELKDVYDDIDYLKELELQIEKDFIYINPKIKDIYNRAIEENKKIIFISDSSLPKSFIEEILKQHNIGYYKLYLSSDVLKRKIDGRLYEFVLNDLQISPRRIIHIGDNFYSDIKMAQSYEIEGYFYQNHLDFCRINSFIEDDSKDLVVSIVDGLCMHKIALKDIKKDFWYLLGYRVAGLLYFGFLVWIDSYVKEQGIKKLVFLSKDGYILKKIYDKFFKKDIKTYYAFISRRAVGYKDDNRLDIDNHTKNIVKEYFEEFIDDKKVFIVDVGWKGSIGYALDKILDDTKVFGFYLGYFGGNRDRFRGYLFDSLSPTKSFVVIQNHSEIVELFFSAPHKSVLFLTKKNNKIMPKFRSENDDLCKSDVFELKKGIEDFFYDFFSLYKKYGLNIDKELTIKNLEKLILKPCGIEAKKIGNIQHFVGLSDKKRFIAKPKYPREFYDKNQEILKEQLNNSYWQVGFLKLLEKDVNILSFDEQIKKIVYDIKNINNIAVFGTAKAGTIVYEFLKYYNLDKKIKYFIDDFKKGKFQGYKIITTNDFLKMKDVDLVIYGKYQKVNPLIENNNMINQMRLFSVI